MKKRLVIFGAGDIAQLAHFYFSTDSDYEVVAFTVDRDFLAADSFCSLPIIAFEDVKTAFPTESHYFFVALSYSGLNALRKSKYLAAKALGFQLASYISSRATVFMAVLIGQCRV